jgi:hypothetical protein
VQEVVRPSHGTFPGTPPCYGEVAILQHRTRMPRTKSPTITGTTELNAMIDRVAPDILEVLADGVPRPKAAIVAALAGRHAEADVALALVRLAVTERVVETGGKYALAEAEP